MNKVAVVTGASRGIGYEIAFDLASKKHHVIAVARSEKELKKLQQHHPKFVRFFTADITNQNHIKKLNTYLANEYSGIDILVNNAGALINKPFPKLTKADWQKMIDTNLVSVIDLTKSLLPLFNKNSHIVNISSMGGFQGSDKFPGLTAYSVAKGAVSILSECLAVELVEHEINVNALCLGSVETEMFNSAFPDFKADVSVNEMGTYIAEFALNGSSFYNGKVLPVALANPA